MAILFIAKTNVYVIRYIEGTSDTKSSVGHEKIFLNREKYII